MGRKKIKYGKVVSLYLSEEVIRKMNIMTENKSGFIEALINNKYDEWLDDDHTEKIRREAEEVMRGILGENNKEEAKVVSSMFV